MIYRIEFFDAEGISTGFNYYGTKKEANRRLAQRRNEARREERLYQKIEAAEMEAEAEALTNELQPPHNVPGEDVLGEWETPKDKRELLRMLNIWCSHADNG